MSSPLHSILQAAKLGYLGHLHSGGYNCRRLARACSHLDHFLHWAEACSVYRADQLGHQLIYDYQNHFDYQLYCVRLTRRRAKTSFELNRHWRNYTEQLEALRGWLFWLYLTGATGDDLSHCVERSLSKTRLDAAAKRN
jgi:hypothetical protein